MGLCVTAGWVALSSALPVALTAGAVLGAVLVSEWIQQTEEPGWAAWIVGTAFTLVACTFARRLRLTVEQLREAQHQLAERSRAEERNRIAAEVHDVVGHALTVSLLHISSARLALDEEPEEARRALGEAERLTRDSLEEVRASVGLMRTDAPGEMAPLPDARAIPELVESFRRAGSIVELAVAGELGTVGPARGLAAYRIVQEALTNAARHAPGEPVSVEISVDHDETTVAVRNDGTVDPSPAAGSGLLGMRDRAEGVGGRLSAGASRRPRDGLAGRGGAAVVTDLVRVLVVDDQELVRTGLRGILRPRFGFEIVGELPSGAGVVEAVAALEPDVVVMDVRMPEVDGVAATRRLREVGGRSAGAGADHLRGRGDPRRRAPRGRGRLPAQGRAGRGPAARRPRRRRRRLLARPLRDRAGALGLPRRAGTRAAGS